MKRLLLAFLLALLPAASASAETYIKDVMVIGYDNKDAAKARKDELVAQGWTWINHDLNTDASGHYIYLLYKTEDNPYGSNQGYITDFYISDYVDNNNIAPDTRTFGGHTYHLVSYDGDDYFTDVKRKGDLNSKAGGDYIHLYYTKDRFTDKRAVSSITIDNEKSGALGVNGSTTTGYSLNNGCSSGSNKVYMHITTATAMAGNAPRRNLDSCVGDDRKITVSGWAFDPDAPAKSIDVHVYIYKSDGATLYMPIQAVKANVSRPDVNSTYGITGNHGFSASFDINDVGNYVVKVYAIDDTNDGNPQIGSTTTVIVTKSVDITIGDGTIVDETLPFSNMIKHKRVSAQIYLSEEIGMAGTITSVSFYNASSDRFRYHRGKVYMKHTEKSNYENHGDWIPISDEDIVYTGDFGSEAAGWMALTLDTPFEYDGIRNILICVLDEGQPFDYDGSGNSVFYAYCHMSNSEGYLSKTFQNMALPALDGTDDLYGGFMSSCERCNLRLTIKPSPYPAPRDLIVNNISHHTATATWSAPSALIAITGYTYQYKKSGEEIWSSEVQTSMTSVTITGLEGGTDYDFRVKTLYGIEESIYSSAIFSTVAYETPTDLAVSNITDERATFSWNAPSNESPTGYVYQYKKSNAESWSSEVQTSSTSVTLNGLSSNTDYNFRIKARYGNYYSSWITIVFLTCYELPYDCGFEDGIGRWSMVSCNYMPYVAYTIYDQSSTGIRVYAKRDGEVGFQFSDFADPIPQYLISPSFYGEHGLVVSFYYRPLSGSTAHAEKFSVGYSATTSDVNAFTWSDEFTANNDNWEKYEHTFPAGTRYIAVKYITNTYRLYLDDFHFEEYSAYAKPTGLTTSSLTNQSATLTWTAPGNASPTGYACQYKKATETTWTNVSTVNGTSVTLNNLPANTTCDFRVKAVYAGNNASNYMTLRFITEGNAVDLPFTESFENGMGGWRVVDGSSDTGIYSDYPRTGSNGFTFDLANAHQYLMSPLINGGKEMVVSFYYKDYSVIEGEYVHNYAAGFKVGYSSTTKDPGAFTWTDEIRSYYEWRQYTATVPADTKYVSVQWVDGYDLYIDDFSISGMQVQLTASKASFNGKEKYLTTFYDKGTSYQLPEGAEAYTVIRDGSELVFLRIGNGDSRVIPAGTPVVIVADKETSDTANTKEITVTALTSCDVSARTGNILQASDTDTAVTGGKIGNQTVYVLGIKNNAAGFYKFTGSSIPAGKAYYLK